MFTAFFVLALVSKKTKKAILKVTYSVTYRKNIKIGHWNLWKARPIGSLTIEHLAKSGNKK